MKIKDIIGTLDYDTIIKVTNRKDGVVFRGYSDEMSEEIADFRIVSVKVFNNDVTKVTGFEIWAVK